MMLRWTALACLLVSGCLPEGQGTKTDGLGQGEDPPEDGVEDPANDADDVAEDLGDEDDGAGGGDEGGGGGVVEDGGGGGLEDPDDCAGQGACDPGDWGELVLECCDNVWGGGTRGCVDIGADPFNCGGCGVVCGEGTPMCIDGACVTCESLGDGASECDPLPDHVDGTRVFGGMCVRLDTDNFNCGACGAACSDGTQCVDGACVGSTCELQRSCGSDGDSDTVCCPNAYGVGEEDCTDVLVDPWNCGGCGTVCAGSDCRWGHCI